MSDPLRIYSPKTLCHRPTTTIPTNLSTPRRMRRGQTVENGKYVNDEKLTSKMNTLHRMIFVVSLVTHYRPSCNRGGNFRSIE